MVNLSFHDFTIKNGGSDLKYLRGTLIGTNFNKYIILLLMIDSSFNGHLTRGQLNTLRLEIPFIPRKETLIKRFIFCLIIKSNFNFTEEPLNE